jgi:hypothetical protein
LGRKPLPKPDDALQSKRFIDAAREADETEEAADQAFKKIAGSMKPRDSKA